MVPVAVDVHNLTDASWSRWRSGHAIAQAGAVRRKARNHRPGNASTYG